MLKRHASIRLHAGYDVEQDPPCLASLAIVQAVDVAGRIIPVPDDTPDELALASARHELAKWRLDAR